MINWIKWHVVGAVLLVIRIKLDVNLSEARSNMWVYSKCIFKK